MNALLVLLRVSGLGLLAALLTASRYKVEGFSMEPSYRHGYHYLVDRSVYRRKPPERGHVVVLTHPSLDGKALLKRVVGLPGERVSLTNSRVLINGELLNEPYLSSPGGANPLRDLASDLAATAENDASQRSGNVARIRSELARVQVELDGYLRRSDLKGVGDK